MRNANNAEGLFTPVGACARVAQRSGGRVNGNMRLTDAQWARIAPSRPRLARQHDGEGASRRNGGADLGWELVTPPTANRVKPWPLNRAAYRARNASERYFGRIKRLRGVACRYHNLAHVYFNQIPPRLHPLPDEIE